MSAARHLTEKSYLLTEGSTDIDGSDHTVDSIEIEEGKVKLLTYSQSVKIISTFAAPFTLSRLAVAVNVIANGFVFAKLGPEAAASGALSTTIVYAIIGPARGALLSTGILIGKSNGIATERLKENDIEAIDIEMKKISKTLKQSLLFGVMLAIPSCGILLAGESALKAIGINALVAAQTQDFLTATAFGILPMYWSTSDQQFALGIQRKNIPLVFGGMFAGLSMLIGYPLAFGAFGLPKLNTAGLGYGLTASAWISFLALRLYFLRNEFKPYQLFDKQLKEIFEEFSETIKLGLPMGFQALTEWGNLAVLTTLIGKVSSASSIAALASIQAITAYTLGTGALGQATSVKISNMLGQMSEAIKQNKLADLETYNANVKRLGNGGIITGALASLVVGGLLVTIPKQIASVFVDADSATSDEVLAMAQAMLLINGIGFLFDTVRNVAASALGGSKDVLFAPILSLISMSLIGLSAGGGLSLFLDWGADWLFITRDVGILLAAVGIAHRWLKKDYMPEENPVTANIDLPEQNPKNFSLRSFCCLFGNAKNNTSDDTEQVRYSLKN